MDNPALMNYADYSDPAVMRKLLRAYDSLYDRACRGDQTAKAVCPATSGLQDATEGSCSNVRGQASDCRRLRKCGNPTYAKISLAYHVQISVQ